MMKFLMGLQPAGLRLYIDPFGGYRSKRWLAKSEVGSRKSEILFFGTEPSRFSTYPSNSVNAPTGSPYG